jgi:glycosyltransferase involved in cell wall biosynthesis
MADVFVFPSLTDTFGLVQLEANACGVPVAAYPVPGPKDVIVDGVNGSLDWDLEKAILGALKVSKRSCIKYAESHSWENCVNFFLKTLVKK